MGDPVGKAGKVVPAVFAELQGVGASGPRGLEVAEHGVDPFEAWHAIWLESAHHHGQVSAHCIGDRQEADPTNGWHDGAWYQVGLGPLAYHVRLAETDLPTSTSSTEVGAVGLNGAVELMDGIL